MSLVRNTQCQMNLSEPKQDLESLWKKIMALREEERQSAEEKYQVSLLLATTEKLCRTLTDFMNGTEIELRKMNGSQLELLNIQEQYKDEIRQEVVNILNNVYSVIQKQQKGAFDKIIEDNQKTVDILRNEVERCTEDCKKAAEFVSAQVAILRRIDCLGAWFLLLSPLLVAADVVLRIIGIFI